MLYIGVDLGTFGTIFISGRTFCVDEYNALHSFAHADGNYHLMGCMPAAVGCSEYPDFFEPFYRRLLPAGAGGFT